jgi:tetratricopeptide (TPR) repeat protein
MYNDEFRSRRWTRKNDVRRLSFSATAAVAVRLVLLAAAGVLTLFAGAAQHPHTPTPGAAEVKRLGAVNFPVSCAASVQADFNRAMALLHSFQYELAEQAFAEVAKKDPQCAMAYWGRALSLYHPVWEWPEPETIQKGHSYIKRADELGAKTSRERGYIHTASIFYQDSTSMKVADRAAAYCNALAGLHDEFPQDHNAAAFYALSLVTSPAPCPTARQGEQGQQSEQKRQGGQAAAGPAGAKTRRMQAIEILTELFRQEPGHPGVAHYLIHATDTPELAHLGLDAARRYASIAPDSPHALHMPSHIFTELGLWQESIQSNLASAAAAESITKSHLGDGSGDQLHALSFLEYAYLQIGHAADAQRVIDEMKSVPGAGAEDIAESEEVAREMYIEETHQWKESAKLNPGALRAPYLHVAAHKARSIGEARTGDTAQAQTDLDGLRKAYEQMAAYMRSVGNPPPEGESTSQLEAEAWLALAQGKQEEALAKMRKAAEQGGGGTRAGGVPGIPAKEMLGNMLLEIRIYAEAQAAYEAALKETPNRFNALYGAAQAAEMGGNREAAKRYNESLRQICGRGADRAELSQKQ